jgi:hypothetical protein
MLAGARSRSRRSTLAEAAGGGEIVGGDEARVEAGPPAG